MSKAPDKIYLEKSLSFPDKFHSQWYREDVVGNGVEYIRKDALVEWAKAKHMELDPPQNERDFGRIEAVEELIKHIESL